MYGKLSQKQNVILEATVMASLTGVIYVVASGALISILSITIGLAIRVT
jgi:hypothetical protein